MIHPAAWFAWLAAAVLAASSTRNPLYLVVLLLIFVMVVEAARRPEVSTPLPITPERFMSFVVPAAAVFNAITTHYGDTVLFSLPKIIPFFGGAVTVEALVYGAVNGLLLSALFAAFTVLNLAVTVRDMIRFIPRAFYPVAVVISIAVTFVPTTLRQIQQIREAQAVRGHRMRKLQDWLPLFMPLLVGGMERALQLAEAMTARGFASEEGAPSSDWSAQAGTVVGLLLVLAGGLLRMAWGEDLWGAAAMAAGALVIGVVIWKMGRRVTYTTYRHTPWTSQDWTVLGGVAVTLLFFLFLSDRLIRYYTPYPGVSLPGFEPWVGGILLGFLVPVAVLVRGWRKPAETTTMSKDEIETRSGDRILTDAAKAEPVPRTDVPFLSGIRNEHVSVAGSVVEARMAGGGE